MIATLGRSDFDDGDEERSSHIRPISARRIYVHPDYNPVNLHNDFALLQLLSPIRYTENVRPICLPDESSCDAANVSRNYTSADGCVEVTTAGWGVTEQQGRWIGLMWKIPEDQIHRTIACPKIRAIDGFLKEYLPTCLWLLVYEHFKRPNLRWP